MDGYLVERRHNARDQQNPIAESRDLYVSAHERKGNDKTTYSGDETAGDGALK